MSIEYKSVKDGRDVAPWVKALKGKSGAYIIKERGILGGIVYIGESHTGRLKETLLRHFQRWKGPTAGPTFKVEAVEVSVVRTRPERALDMQNALIEEYRPELNTVGKPGFWETIFGK